MTSLSSFTVGTGRYLQFDDNDSLFTVMSRLADYMAEKRAAMAESYSGNCLRIALEVAGLLRSEGKAPVVYTLSRVEKRGEDLFYGPLSPLRYRGKVTWTRHYVCCCDGQAFDPMLPEPTPVEGYTRAAFGIDIPLEVIGVLSAES
ncbi:MAG TPA: hypothetical protein VKM94_21015 [Blastocatellia bacterium]|nr:hypothetical protein [Blastocatellia bacterium]